MISLIVGLGNPGADYAFNRHNVGFMMIDALAHSFAQTNFTRKGHSMVCEARIENHKVMLMKPMTFMNKSGIAVAHYAGFYKLEPSSILVIHDEMALPFLKIRTKQGGGHAGHNGLKSLDSCIGKDYWRLRVGIDHPGDPTRVTGHVLGNFSPDERDSLPLFLKTFIEHFPLFLTQSPEVFQSKMASPKVS